MKMFNCVIPIAIQVVIDDVGWWSGKNSSKENGPYRTGFVRDHVPADYQAIVDLGKALGMRPQAAMLLSEWDRGNELAEFPNCSEFGESWDNRQWNGPWLDEAAEIINNNQPYFEIVLHGINHEHWENGLQSRGEWFEKDGAMRPRELVIKKLDLFKHLLESNGLGGFPSSFVPPAFIHNFAAGYELSDIFKNYGIKYISTPFSAMLGREKVQHKFFGVDRGIITIDRGEDIFDWVDYACDPNKKEKDINGPVCGMHWPNLLHEIPDRNGEVVNIWADYLRSYEDRIDFMLATDTAMAATQLAYQECTGIKQDNATIEFDFSQLDELGVLNLNNSFFIKISTHEDINFIAQGMLIVSQSWDKKNLLFTLELQREKRKCGLLFLK